MKTKVSKDILKLKKLTEETVEHEESELENIGVAGLINLLIRDEWEAIDAYQSAIATITETHPEIVEILDDILTEEMIHVGQLQKALTLVQPESMAIADGENEAEEQLILK